MDRMCGKSEDLYYVFCSLYFILYFVFYDGMGMGIGIGNVKISYQVEKALRNAFST